MLWTICVTLLLLWAVGMATSYTMGGLIHILLLIAVVMVIVRLIQGRIEHVARVWPEQSRKSVHGMSLPRILPDTEDDLL
jgi:hypothetical protein